MERISLNSSLGKLLEWCQEQAATDLHAQADRRYSYRVDGWLLRIAPDQFLPPTGDDIVKLLRQAFSSTVCDRIERPHEMDLSFLCDRLRYRANFSKQQGVQSFSLRVVPQRVPQLDELQLPPAVSELVKEPRGLLLVTGAAGQGKSTTACALLQRLNETLALDAIARNDLQLLNGIIEASASEGMQSFDQHLIQLLTSEAVTVETARYYAINWNRLEMERYGYSSSLPGILKPDLER